MRRGGSNVRLLVMMIPDIIIIAVIIINVSETTPPPPQRGSGQINDTGYLILVSLSSSGFSNLSAGRSNPS